MARVKNNPSPHVRPSNSDDEGSLGGDGESYCSQLDAEDAEEGLVIEDDGDEEVVEEEEKEDEEDADADPNDNGDDDSSV